MCYEQWMGQPLDAETSDVTVRQRNWWEGPWQGRSAAALAAIAAGILGAWLGVAIAGTTSTHLGPLSIDAEISPSFNGQTVLELDPLGTLIFDTHRAPLELTIDVRSVEPAALEQIMANPASINGLEEQLQRDLDDALRQTAVRTLVVAVVGAVLIGGLVFRTVRRALLAGAIAIGAVVGSYGLALLTFDRTAVEEPRFTGLLSTAPRLVGTVQAITADFSDYTRQLATLVTNVSRTYNAAISLPTFAPTDDATRVLFVADLHLNPAAWQVIGAVSEQYEVDAIVDAGDIVDHGTALESQFVQEIGTLDVPYIFVKGNHDSVLTAAAVADQPNAIVLDNESEVVAGLRFYGAPDPRFTPDKSTRGIADEQIREGSEELAETLEGLPVPPDVLVYHDPTHAELFDGSAPLVLAGHMHTRNVIDLEGGTRVFVQGSTGGAGLRGLQYEDPTPVAMSVLYFDPDTRRLVAWDDITLGGFGLRSAEVERHQADDGEPESDESSSPPPELPEGAR